MIKDLFDGIFKYLKVIRVANEFHLWKYLLWSGLISLLTGSIIIYVAFKFGENFGEWLFGWYKWSTGGQVVAFLDDWIGSILVIVLTLILFKYLVLIIASPFMSFVSEQLERQLADYPAHQTFSLGQALGDLYRGVVLNLRNLTREMFLTVLLMVLGLIPFVALILPVLLFLLQAYYAGFGNLDYLLERHRNVKGSVAFVRKHRLLAIGNGAGFLILLMIPVLGWFIAPFFATIAGTLGGLERLRKG